MSLKQPLNSTAPKKKSVRSRASIFYGADEYLSELKNKFADNPEMAMMYNMHPDGGHEHAGDEKGKTGSVLAVKTNDENRSHMTGRLFPVSNKPDPMPAHLAFLFQKITPAQMMYMWNVLTMIFFLEVILILVYGGLLRFVAQVLCGVKIEELSWGIYLAVTIPWGVVMAYTCVQNIYIDHDVMHGATWPPADWQKYITHPFSDFFSLPWEEFVLEHNRHHGSTVDLLIQGEFGWDPEMLQYKFLTWSNKWYLLMLTFPLCPLIHFFGINDTGSLFAMEWMFAFPDEAPGGKCSKSFYSKWLPNRARHISFVWSLWACVWLFGTWPMGRNLSDGWKFVIPVTISCRCGFTAAWMFITNFTHSPQWNRFLANDPDRTFPFLHSIMAFILGGRHRWNEMLFHDAHHAFPNAIGTMSQRGRFHGWLKVHDAAVEVLERGIWKPNGDEETEMQKNQRKRSMLVKSRK